MEIMTSVQISGQKLYQKRLERLWSRRELASNAGLTEDHIGKLERVENTRAHMQTIRKLVDALECAPADITAEK